MADSSGTTEKALSERIELARRVAIPFAALIFPLLAIPLGLQPVRAVRSRGLAMSLAIILIYYLLLTAGDALAANEVLPVPVALWLPNSILGVSGMILFFRASREARPPFEGKASGLIDSIRNQFQTARSES